MGGRVQFIFITGLGFYVKHDDLEVSILAPWANNMKWNAFCKMLDFRKSNMYHIKIDHLCLVILESGFALLLLSETSKDDDYTTSHDIYSST